MAVSQDWWMKKMDVIYSDETLFIFLPEYNIMEVFSDKDQTNVCECAFSPFNYTACATFPPSM